MIRLLKGQLHSKENRTIILFTNGVGYHVFVPGSILNSEEQELTLFIHTHVREDAITLYGFRTKKELNFFELLLTVSGIGPKLAMDISSFPTEKIENAILTNNLLFLTQIPGIGKKLAERMVLELKSKVSSSEENSQTASLSKEIHPDVFSALENLGYKRSHIQNVLSEVEEDVTETEEWIRIFLRSV